MTDEAKAARDAYRKKWRAEHPEKVKEYNRRYWERKAEAKKAAKLQADKPAEAGGTWSNESCRGYLIAAMSGAGHSGDEITAAMDKLTAAFNDIGIDQAAEVWRKWKR